MNISRLRIRNLRCIKDEEICPGKGINFVVGPNGAGKSTLLESIYLLGHGRSFLRSEAEKLVSRGQKQGLVFGEVEEGEGRVFRVGIAKEKGGGRFRLEGRDVRSNREVAQRFPVAAFYPGREAVIWGGPGERRRLLDWLVFHVEPDFGDLATAYAKALKGRNALLKQGRLGPVLRAWDKELGALGEQLHLRRQAVTEEFLPTVEARVGTKLQTRFSAIYRKGWGSELSLAEVLEEGAHRDLTQGWTGVGPHKADLDFKVEGARASDFLSRGQGKGTALEIFFAAVEFLHGKTGKSPVVLLDDIFSEVDEENLRGLLLSIGALGLQVFLTGVTQPGSETFPSNVPLHMFHVEQGRFTKML